MGMDSKGPTRTDQLEIRQHSVDIVDSLRGCAIRVAGVHKSRVIEVIWWSESATSASADVARKQTKTNHSTA